MYVYYLMFQSEGMVPWPALDGSKVNAPSPNNNDVEVLTWSWRRLFVHCKVDVQSRTTADWFLSWRHNLHVKLLYGLTGSKVLGFKGSAAFWSGKPEKPIEGIR
jgi:hypothetical protein